MAEHRVCRLNDIALEVPKVVRLEGVGILVCRDAQNTVFAFENKCTHQDLPLHKGPWDPSTACLGCPVHGAVFSLREEGRAVVGPAVVSLELFPVRIVDEDGTPVVYVSVP
jgi:nitrite reductase/ring-hydroxylating ferredoxin subunit